MDDRPDNVDRGSEHCQLCGRSGPPLTRHHLIPRARHRNKRTRRHYSRSDRETRLLWVCRPCHHHIHALFSEKELAADYNTRDRLLSHPEIQRFVQWIADKPAGFKPKSRPRKRGR